MTIDKLIQRLEQIRGEVGGTTEVKVIDDDGAWGFMLHAEQIEGEAGTTLLIDVTGEPE